MTARVTLASVPKVVPRRHDAMLHVGEALHDATTPRSKSHSSRIVELGVMASWNAPSLSPLDRAEQAEQPIDRRERMGRAPRNPQVHRQDVADAARDLRAPNERAPADGARAHGDYQLRGWHGRIRFFEREPHVGVDRSRDDD